VMIFTSASVADDPEKAEVVRNIYTGVARG